ncbi:MAG: hypothetical protein ABIQ18_18290 [Umezawaea sp.]
MRGGDKPSVLSVAASHLPMYAAAVMAIVAEHQPDAEGNCETCSRPSRWGRSRRVHSPCKAMIVVQFALSNPMAVLDKYLHRTGHAPVLTAR